MDPKDYGGKPIHYSSGWGQISWSDGWYRPGKMFRVYTPAPVTLVLKGTRMDRSDVFAINLTSKSQGYCSC